MRFRRSIICSCGVDTFYYTKGKCNRCYQSALRQTPEAREKRRLYWQKNRKKMQEYMRRYREKYVSKKAAVPRQEPLRRTKPLPRPTKRIRVVSKSPRRQEIRRKDREFQESGERNWCAVGHWAEQTTWHHRKSRRFIKTRWDKQVCFRFCLPHHEEIERIEEKAFLKKYPKVLDNPEGIPPSLD